MRQNTRRGTCPHLHRSALLSCTAVLLLVILAGCASTAEVQPVLYPNARLQQAGRAAADQEIQECRQLARDHGVRETRDGEVARKSAGGAAIGGAAGGAWGLVSGDAVERALAGAAAGAATGAVRGTLQSGETSPLFKNFVQKCLRDRGYEVIGWQ
jgi:outer membrane lipoprotein SlyB